MHTNFPCVENVERAFPGFPHEIYLRQRVDEGGGSIRCRASLGEPTLEAPESWILKVNPRSSWNTMQSWITFFWIFWWRERSWLLMLMRRREGRRFLQSSSSYIQVYMWWYPRYCSIIPAVIFKYTPIFKKNHIFKIILPSSLSNSLKYNNR